MSRRASKKSAAQATPTGNRFRFTIMVDSATYEVLTKAHETLNYRQVAQVAIAQFAAEWREREQAQISA